MHELFSTRPRSVGSHGEAYSCTRWRVHSPRSSSGSARSPRQLESPALEYKWCQLNSLERVHCKQAYRKMLLNGARISVCEGGEGLEHLRSSRKSRRSGLAASSTPISASVTSSKVATRTLRTDRQALALLDTCRRSESAKGSNGAATSLPRPPISGFPTRASAIGPSSSKWRTSSA